MGHISGGRGLVTTVVEGTVEAIKKKSEHRTTLIEHLIERGVIKNGKEQDRVEMSLILGTCLWVDYLMVMTMIVYLVFIKNNVCQQSKLHSVKKKFY